MRMKKKKTRHRLFNYDHFTSSSSKSKVAKRKKKLVFPPSSSSAHVLSPYIYIHTHIRQTFDSAHTFARCPFITARTEPRSLHTCATLVFHSSSGTTEWQKRAQVVSLPRSANKSLDVYSGFPFSPRVKRRKLDYIYRSISFLLLFISILSR